MIMNMAPKGHNSSIHMTVAVHRVTILPDPSYMAMDYITGSVGICTILLYSIVHYVNINMYKMLYVAIV